MKLILVNFKGSLLCVREFLVSVGVEEVDQILALLDAWGVDLVLVEEVQNLAGNDCVISVLVDSLEAHVRLEIVHSS